MLTPILHGILIDYYRNIRMSLLLTFPYLRISHISHFLGLNAKNGSTYDVYFVFYFYLVLSKLIIFFFIQMNHIYNDDLKEE